MDPITATQQASAFDSFMLTMLVLAFGGLGTVIAMYGRTIRSDIGKLFDKVEEAEQQTYDFHEEINHRVGKLAQRVTKLDGQMEE